jgi:hypothetical protein
MRTDVVIDAFGYSDAVIARGLVAAGHQVRTLTGHPDRAGAQTEIGTAGADIHCYHLRLILESTDHTAQGAGRDSGVSGWPTRRR